MSEENKNLSVDETEEVVVDAKAPKAKSDKNCALCVLLSIALSCAFYFIPFLKSVPSGFSIIICATLASVVFAILKPVEDEEEVAENA